MNQEMIDASVEITDVSDCSSQYPGIAIDAKGRRHVCWQEYKDGHDQVWAGWLDGGKVQDLARLSGQGEALRPVACTFQDAVWYAWSEYSCGKWQILARHGKEGEYSPIITVAKGEALFYPFLFVDGDQLLVVYNEQGKGYSRCVAARLGDGAGNAKEVVSKAKKAYRPTGCQGGDGRSYVVYDVFHKGEDGSQEGTYDVFARVKLGDRWSPEVKVSNTKFWATRPVVVPSLEGATVCWYEYGDRAVFSYCAADISVVNGQLACQNLEALSSNQNWYHDVSAASNQKGTAVFAYTWGKYNINVRCRLKGGKWSEPVVMSYDDGHCGVHPAVALDQEDNIHLLWQRANKNGHMDRNASIVYNVLNAAQMAQHADQVVEKAVDQFVQPVSAPKSFASRFKAEVEAWLGKNGYGDMMLLFGDIHGQSGISDGVGEIDQYYHYAKAKANLDFTALTDHDCYPDWISQSEWEWMRTTNRLMNTDGELSCLLAYEWTPNEYQYDFGHKNVYYRGDQGDIFRSGDQGGMTPFRLFESLKPYGAMAFPHHPAADWQLVSAATDWNFHDPKVQRLVEIFSRHANFEDDESQSKYTKNIKKMKGRSVQDALARGYHMGFTAGSDSHQMEHGIEGGIFAVLVPEFTREAVFDAMYDRFTYATTGARILASLKIGTAHMGQEVTLRAGQPVMLDASVMATAQGKVQVLKNNQVIREEEGGDQWDFSFVDPEWGDGDYYYLRVVQEDGHMAWTSPIWVRGV